MKQDASGSRRRNSAESVSRTAALVDSVAAIFVDPRGFYPLLVGAERCWDAKRDAMTYAGPWPVVAHPPCQLWGSFAVVNYKRWGGEHNRPGNDGGKFAHALKCVRVWGGVLEHPAFSKAWATFGLQKPDALGWRCVGDGPGWRTHWVCEVWQSAYGHKARKRTWLYYVGARPPFDLRWERPVGTHQCGFHDQRGKARNKPTLSKKDANETPRAFAEDLVRLAQAAKIGNHSPDIYAFEPQPGDGLAESFPGSNWMSE
jgi:hypothetical protein